MAHHLEHKSLQWRHNGCDSVSNHQPHDCLLNRLFRRRSKKTSKLRVTGLCAGNSSGTSEFHAQMASYAENVSIWWRYHVRDRSVRVFGASIWNKLEKCMLRYRFKNVFKKNTLFFSIQCMHLVDANTKRCISNELTQKTLLFGTMSNLQLNTYMLVIFCVYVSSYHVCGKQSFSVDGVSCFRSPAWWVSGLPRNPQRCTLWFACNVYMYVIDYRVALLEINLLLLTIAICLGIFLWHIMGNFILDIFINQH